MDVLELMIDLRVQKDAFKANIKNKYEVKKIRRENEEIGYDAIRDHVIAWQHRRCRWEGQFPQT